MKNILAICFLYCLLCSAVIGSHARQHDVLRRHLQARRLRKHHVPVTTFANEFQAIDETQIHSQEGLKESDRIDKLPGQPRVGFTQYGGYVTVNKKHGRALYYYFVEAEKNKESKPLVLWLNGGPGCSSLGYGAMEELGPFRVDSTGKTLFQNPYAWNKVANVLFLESPAGVGFSYTNTTSDLYDSGDRRTAHDNYVFLVNWLKRFPEYKDRDFYIAGESYAGNYVPQLAHNVLKHNEDATTKINLKGIIIGNAVINSETDNHGTYDYLWTHALLSDEAIHNINKYCNFSVYATDDDQPSQCTEALDEVNNTYNVLDPYNIYAPLCHSENVTDTPKKESIIADPCSDYYIGAYLNNPEVQKALHANVTEINYQWTACSDDLFQNWQDSGWTVIPLLKDFMAKGLRVWVFSGDTDGIVPVTATRYSLHELKAPIKTKFHPWFFRGEVGGYTMTYEGDLTFATVRGAGHEVPSYQPQRVFSLIKHFLDGKPLPIH